MKPRIQWGRLLRRSLALFLATLAVWALLVCSGGGSAANAFRSLGQDPGFVSAALSAELGQVAEDDGPLSGLSGWARLVVDQSPLLRGNGDAVAGHLDGSAPATPDLPAGQPAQDHDDISEPPPETTAAPEDIIARTLVPTSTQGYEVSGSLYLYNRTGLDVDLAAAAAAPVNIALPAEGPQILIVHTHGSEAYTPDGTDIYEPSDNNTRTLDENYNVVRVGDEMERVFTELGLTVVHDRTLYDYPKYNGAYDRSAEAVQRYLEQYPSIKIVLDVHRDALVGEDGTVYKAVTRIDGVDTAQVMLVLGSSEGGEHPNWMQNLSLACRIQESMNTLYPTLARPMTMRSSRYNQQLSNGSLLVEVGTHGPRVNGGPAAVEAHTVSGGGTLLHRDGGRGSGSADVTLDAGTSRRSGWPLGQHKVPRHAGVGGGGGDSSAVSNPGLQKYIVLRSFQGERPRFSDCWYCLGVIPVYLRNTFLMKNETEPKPHQLMGYRLCVFASGSLITDIFSCFTLIKVSCLHFGQYRG